MAKIKELRCGDIFCEEYFSDRYEALGDPVFENGISISGLATMNRARLLIKRAKETISFYEQVRSMPMTFPESLCHNESRKKR
jgi:hypothetical protein